MHGREQVAHPVLRLAAAIVMFADGPLTVAFLLPNSPPPALLQSLPASSGSLRVIILAIDDALPLSEEHIPAVVWVPPCPPTRLEAFLDAHKELKWVHSMSAGIDSIADVVKRKLANSEIALSNGRGAFSDSLAEYAIASALYFNKQFKRCEQNRRDKKWDRFVMPTIAGKTMGFVGYGHIARTTAKLAAPLGLRLVALRRKLGKGTAPDEPVLAATYSMEQQAEFYSQCDFVVCSLPLTNESHRVIGASAFAAMKPSSVFISLGRGAVIDETALYDALRNGHIAGAACDGMCAC